MTIAPYRGKCRECGHDHGMGGFEAPKIATTVEITTLRAALERAEAERDAAVRSAPPALTGKYGNVLSPFVALMEAELHANAGKGDRAGWMAMTRAELMLEIYYHAAKLQKAAKDSDVPRIREHAADVANMAMMLLDVCGGLEADRREGDDA